MQKYFAHADSVSTESKQFDIYVEVYLAIQVDAELATCAERDARYMDELDKRDARIAELKEAVRIYGGHIPNCPGRPCECGYQAVWDGLTS